MEQNLSLLTTFISHRTVKAGGGRTIVFIAAFPSVCQRSDCPCFCFVMVRKFI